MNVFLSASVPLPIRSDIYYRTADVAAIRDAIKGLVTVAVERRIHLVFGGHPAITPLVALLYRQAGLAPGDHIQMYQSGLFAPEFPVENNEFGDLIVVPPVGNDRAASLVEMRRRMISENKFDCGVFIGGMEGVEEEFEMFAKHHPKSPVYPVASTGAAAAILYRRHPIEIPALEREVSYSRLFRRLLSSSGKA